MLTTLRNTYQLASDKKHITCVLICLYRSLSSNIIFSFHTFNNGDLNSDTNMQSIFLAKWTESNPK